MHPKTRGLRHKADGSPRKEAAKPISDLMILTVEAIQPDRWS
jgi:hypothetical protein